MFDSQQIPLFTALVLAGDRGPDDPLTQYTGAPCKALVPIEGVPMLYRVLDTLEHATQVRSSCLSGPDETSFSQDNELKLRVSMGRIAWQPPESTPSTSAYRLMEKAQDKIPFLLTTADHPLLTPAVVDEFCSKSAKTSADVTVGLAPYNLVQKQFPDMKKTVIRLKDGQFCGCNLFSFMTPDGIRVADFWRTIEQQRKRPLKLISMLGWRYVLRYRLGMLTIDQALSRLSELIGLRIRAVILEHGEAAVDVDSISDYKLVQAKFAKREQSN